MKLIKELEHYKPYNAQEKEDQQKMLRYLNEGTDLFHRENNDYHFTASAWIVNQTFDCVLMVYHNIYQSYSWSGGHADGDCDLLRVAIKEVKEETGLTVSPFIEDIFSLEILDVIKHQKRGKDIQAHQHLNITYLFQAKDTEYIRNKADENLHVLWIDIHTLDTMVSEKHMLPIYHKLMKKLTMYITKKKY